MSRRDVKAQSLYQCLSVIGFVKIILVPNHAI